MLSSKTPLPAKSPYLLAFAALAVMASTGPAAAFEGTQGARAKTRTELNRAVKNATLSRIRRIREASTLLGRQLRPNGRQARAILKAHEVGNGEPGKDQRYEAGILKTGRTNYSHAHLRTKTKVLKEAGFNKSEIRTLFDNGIAGGLSGRLVQAGAEVIATETIGKEGIEVSVVQGDVTRLPVDGVVVPHFEGGASWGGVGAAVASRGGADGIEPTSGYWQRARDSRSVKPT